MENTSVPSLYNILFCYTNVAMSSSKQSELPLCKHAPVSFDLEKSLEKLTRLAAEAVEGGADLVVFP